MALNFRPYDDAAGRETRRRWAGGLEDIFNTYMASKQNAQQQGRLSSQDAMLATDRANAEKDRQGQVLLGGGVDPRTVTPDAMRLAGQPAPIMTEESPVIAAIRAHIEKRKASQGLQTREAEAGIGLTNARADALGRDQIYVDPDTGRQIAAPKGAKLIPRIPAGKQPVNPDLNSALELYETAKKGLMEGLGGSETGAIVGMLPAITAKQQIAKGSVAAMAPVLKQLFRTAGEGVFTDRDQQLLLDMVPGRTDLPEARNAMIANIDAIVKAKLKSSNRIQAAPEEAAPINLTGEKAARLAELRAKRGR